MKRVYLEFKQGKSLTCIKFLFTVEKLACLLNLVSAISNEFHTFKLVKNINIHVQSRTRRTCRNISVLMEKNLNKYS